MSIRAGFEPVQQRWKGNTLSQRWAIWLAIDGDLRFGSHHDMMRSCQRAAVRAGLSLHYTQGFNPHPVLSLACPRPVGVASRDDLLVLTLDEPVDCAHLMMGLQAAAAPGMTVLDARLLPPKATPQPVRSDFELPLDADAVGPVTDAAATIQSQDTWPVERRTKKSPRKRRDTPGTHTIDIKPSVVELIISEAVLRFSIEHRSRGTARPVELLRLLGLPETALATLTRTHTEYTLGDAPGDFRRADMKDECNVTRNVD
jgi:radical SAM-linked protein